MAWQTTCTICGEADALVIDGPVTPGELRALAARVTAAEVVATHADWDHLLAPLAFPAARRRAGAATIARLAQDHAQIAGELRRWDAARGQGVRTLPDWRAAAPVGAADLASGAGPIAAFGAPGHTRDGMAFLITDAGVLVVGDYLSPCEIPAVGPGGLGEDYLATLDRLGGLLGEARLVVPGHGWPVGTDRARTLLAHDRRYVSALVAGGDPPLPRRPADPGQRAVHRANLAARDRAQPGGS